MNVQSRAGHLSTIWKASVTKRLVAGESGERPILRLRRRRPTPQHFIASSHFRKCASRFFRKCACGAASAPCFGPFRPPADHKPCRQALSFPKIRVGTGHCGRDFRDRLALPAGARLSNAYFVKPPLSYRVSPTPAPTVSCNEIESERTISEKKGPARVPDHQLKAPFRKSVGPYAHFQQIGGRQRAF